MERAIEHAICIDTKDKFDISKDTNTQKDRFELRKSVQNGERKFECLECGQKLTVAVSSKDFIYFKHYPKSEDCALKNASKLDIKSFNEYYAAKESPRHIFLKNQIGSRLRKFDGITDVHIDDKFLIIGKDKRRPDVYCNFNGFKIAFEIQLSDLSLSYISSRHDFYKKNGIYLVWILDNFDPEQKKQLVRDIKYLNTYQNFFKLDEDSEDLKLICKYKDSYITPFYKVQDKWKQKSVKLNELTFCESEAEVYYKNYGVIREDKEQKAIHLKIEEEERQEQIRIAEQTTEAIDSAERVIQKIRKLKKDDVINFGEVERDVMLMSKLEIKQLNLKLNYPDLPIIAEWIKKSRRRNQSYFILFFLECERIQLDVNLSYEDKSCFQLLLKNDALIVKNIMYALINRGYKITEEDRLSCKTTSEKDDLILFEIAEKLGDKNLIKRLSEDINIRLIYIIESIKRGSIINSNLNNWLAFGNNLIQHYYGYWDYVEKALKKFEVWEEIQKSDKKNTFKNKLEFLKLDYPEQKKSFRELFDKIYPELK